MWDTLWNTYGTLVGHPVERTPVGHPVERTPVGHPVEHLWDTLGDISNQKRKH